MSPEAQTLQAIRALKGPPLTIFLTMRVVRKPATQRKLCTLCGHSEKTVGAALEILDALGYVTRDNYRKWQLTPDAHLRLPGIAEVGESPTSAPTTTAIPTPSQEIQDSKDNSESVDAAVVAARNRRISESVAILRNAGIGEPMRSRLAEMRHVTPEFARAHVRRARGDMASTGLLIRRIANADAKPEPWPWYDRCPDCRRDTLFRDSCPVCDRCSDCCECEATEPDAAAEPRDEHTVQRGSSPEPAEGAQGALAHGAGAHGALAHGALAHGALAHGALAHGAERGRKAHQWSGERHGMVTIGDLIGDPFPEAAAEYSCLELPGR